MRNNHFTKGINRIRLNPLNNRHFAFLFILLNSIMGVNNAMQAQCTPATQTFYYTGGVQDFVVPNSINRITFSATGADGGDDSGSTGGSGGSINASFSVLPGDNIRMIVGEVGKVGYGGGGGGGTAVINCGNPSNCATGTLLLVTGGGGGGWSNTHQGGGATSVAGSGNMGSTDAGGGGGGGGVIAPSNYVFAPNYKIGEVALKTAISRGGMDDFIFTLTGGKGFGGGGASGNIGGAGGGGGYTGGDGSIFEGKGGSNYVDASAIAGFTNTAGTTGGGSGKNGVVVLSYTCPDPCLAFTNNRAYVNAGVTSSGDGSSWAKAFKTLQEALTLNCPSITQIWVAQGTYYPDEGGSFANNDITAAFVMKNNLAIYGGFSGNGSETMLSERDWTANPTILSGDINKNNTLDNARDSRHVIFNNFTLGSPLTNSAVLDGFTISGGFASGYNGAGMYNKYASPTISHCNFSNNTAISNYSRGGGGGMYNEDSSPTISYCTFSNNTVLNSYGGGINNNNSTPTISYCTFSNNLSSGSGYGGGGMANFSSSPTVSYCAFLNNTLQGSGRGGGMLNEDSSPSVSNCIFSGNHSTSQGGGMHNRSGTASIINCTFSGNTAGVNFGGGMSNDLSTCTPTVKNCIFWGNGTDEIVNFNGANPSVTYCDVKGGYAGTGNINVDPLFVDPASDLHLQNGSPAINAGTATGAPVDDYDGDARPLGGGFDMGYDESTYIPPVCNLIVATHPSVTNSVCSGNSVTLTAKATATGSMTVKWQRKGVNDADYSDVTTATTYTSGTNTDYTITAISTDDNNAMYRAVFASSACTNPVNTNAVTLSVNPVLTPSVSLGVSTGTTICAGTSVTFTATPMNGGTTPTYKWTINTTIQAETGATLTRSNLANNDVVKVELTSNATCVSPTTATDMKTMTVNPVLTPSVSLGVSPSTTICAGTSVTFTATPTNGGTTPTYKWTIGTTVQAETGATLTRSNLANNDVVKVEMTSNATCASPTTTTDMKTMTVNPVLTPSVSLGVSTGTTICAGTSVIFTATPTNGGTTPTYKWTIGTTVQAETGATLTRSNLANNDVVKVELTSNALCLSTPTATATKTMVVSPTISVDAGATCLQVYSGYDAASGCTTLTATASGNGTTGYTFKWSTNATTPSINVCPTVNTSYTVTATKGACSATDKVDVKVLNVSCDKNKTQVCHNGLTVCIAKKDVPFHLAHGDKLGKCGANNLCENSSALIANEKTHAFSDKMDAELNIQLYPNPSYQVVTLQMDNIREGIVQFDIMDLAGRIIQHSQQRVDEGFSIITLDLQDLSKGLYIVRVKDRENREAFVKLSKL